MKQFILAVLVVCFTQTVVAQNLGDKFDWLKLSYQKIPLRSNLPYYDTLVKLVDNLDKGKLETNARYYFENVIAAPSVDVNENKFSGKGTYTLFTNAQKDEEHTYTVNYIMDITVKDGKYQVEMHDFEIYFLTNKVEFHAKYKHAASDDGKSNYFMALFNDQNHKEIKKLTKVMNCKELPSEATAIK